MFDFIENWSAPHGNPEMAFTLTYVAATPSMPPADVAVKIAKTLGVSVEYLVTGEDYIHNSKYTEIQEIVKDLTVLNKEQLSTVKKWFMH